MKFPMSLLVSSSSLVLLGFEPCSDISDIFSCSHFILNRNNSMGLLSLYLYLSLYLSPSLSLFWVLENVLNNLHFGFTQKLSQFFFSRSNSRASFLSAGFYVITCLHQGTFTVISNQIEPTHQTLRTLMFVSYTW